ncbi:Amt family ammonium transporter [Motilibacter rhizosphaerae]|uniref:Ammonium transporter n=1 Tax=Motilibacter rhizosphaerae TaxID=598652 RepID=A0A4Q7NPU5_9ACTN|nr:ammonium transporter [Motilibacter rhizosphaerae]RZS86996.1 Amt family ammonium transporter [Motilibacter rhizosphaerae]
MQINSGDAAWMLASSALVLFMTPGLAFFYGGMVRSKSVLNMLMMNFACIGVVTLLWVLFGYSLAFKGTNPVIGNFDAFGLKGTITGIFGAKGDQYPELIFSAFQLMFAIITPALISGSIADRVKFGAWITFVALWTTIVYFPVAHWVFYFNNGQGGWIADHLHAMDFAGGTAVHINAGAAGLALAIVLRKRVGWPREPMRPHNLPLVLLGAGILWFGWFGFNAGSAVTAGSGAALAFMNTQVATASAAIGWIVVEKVRDGHSTTLGIASGAVAGLVAITPACGSINPIGAIILGIAAGAICAFAVGLKYRFGFDDSLDVVGVHLVGGIVGTLAIGVLATGTAIKATGSLGQAGFWDGGDFTQLGKQALAAGAVLAYSFIIAAILGFAIDKTIGFTVDEETEVNGIDQGVHAETGYEFSGFGGSLGGAARSVIGTQGSQERIDA